MSGNNTETDGLWAFIKKVWGGVVFFAGIVSAVLGCISWWRQGNSGLFTLVLIGVGICLFLLTCIYYVRFWKPETEDGKSVILLPNSRNPVESQGVREKRRKRVRWLARLGLMIIPFLVWAGFAIYRYQAELPPKDFIILVADFEGVESQDYAVTKEIFKNLEREMEGYTNVKVENLNKSLTKIEAAREEGKLKKAAIVIWGEYREIDKDKEVRIWVHFEILKPFPEFLELGQEVKGKSQPVAIAELKSFELQTRLSQEMTYLSFFTLGIYRYLDQDWDKAIQYFSQAIKVLKNGELLFNPNPHDHLAYFYRGYISAEQGNYQGGLADYNQTIKIAPNFDLAYNNRGFIYSKLENTQNEIADYNRAIEINPEFATAYYNRGLLFGKDLRDYKKAISDFNKSIKLIPEDAQLYVDRGNAYKLLGEIQSAIDDYSQAIIINPQLAEAYYNLGIVYSQQNQPEKALEDLQRASTLFQAQEDITNYQRTLDRIREIKGI